MKAWFLVLLLPFWAAAQGVDRTKEIEEIKRFLVYEEQNDDLRPILPDCIKALKSNDRLLQIAAMRMFISAGIEYPEAIPQVLKMLEKYPLNRKEEDLTGYAIATLLTICRDENIFLKLFETTDKSRLMTLSSAFLDSDKLTPAIRAKLQWPEPEFGSPVKSYLQNGDFENGLDNWDFKLKEGAQGVIAIDNKIKRSGNASLKITKSNGIGYIELRSKTPIEIPAGKTWYWRGFYHASDAPDTSLLLFWLEDENGKINECKIPVRGISWIKQGQSFLLNAPDGEWNKRLFGVKGEAQAEKFYPIIRIYGNPLTVWIDDLTFPSPEWKYYRTARIPEPPRHTMAEAQEILEKRNDSTAKIACYPSGATGIEINGKLYPPIIYFPYMPDFADFKAFEESSISIHNTSFFLDSTSGPHSEDPMKLASGSAWPTAANNKYNFAPLIMKLKKLLRQNPYGYIILGIYVQWPLDYFEKNPGMEWLDENGNPGWGNTLHLSGFRKEKASPNEFKWPSPYINKPFEDAANVITAFVEEIRKNGLDKMIIGGFVLGGHDGQFEIRYRDYSQYGVTAWRKWLGEKYKTDSTLQKAWNSPTVKLDTVKVPSQKEVNTRTQENQIFLDPAKEMADYDYETFREERIWWVKECLVGAIKKAFNKPMLGVAWQMDKFFSKDPSFFFKSNVLDIIVTQPPYQHRRPGMLTGDMTAFESMKKHNKLWITELDLRTWVRETYGNEISSMKIGTPMNLSEFKGTLRKLTAEQIVFGGGGWWLFDIDNNHFANPEIMKEIKRGVEVFKEVNSQNCQLKMDVAIVMKRDAICSQRFCYQGYRAPVSWLLLYQGFSYYQAGVPFDTWYLDDLFNSPKADKYKLYIFPNAFDLSDFEKKFIEKKLKRAGKTLVFHYAPGYVCRENNKLDIEDIKKLTGMNVRFDAMPRNYQVGAVNKQLLPLQGIGDIFRAHYTQTAAKSHLEIQRFTIDDPKVTAFGKYLDDDTTAIGMRKYPEWTSVYIAAPASMSAEFFNLIAKEAGAYRICEANIGQVVANKCFLSVYSMKNITAPFKLPQESYVVDAFSGEMMNASKTDTIELKLNAGETRWFLLKQ